MKPKNQKKKHIDEKKEGRKEGRNIEREDGDKR